MSGRIMSADSLRFGKIQVILIFAALFPIVPSYFYIAGISARNLLLLGSFFLLAMIELRNKVRIVKEHSVFTFLCLWVGLTSCSMLVYEDYLYMFFHIMLWLGMGVFLINGINHKKIFIKVIDTIIYTSGVVGILGIIEEIFHFNLFGLLNTTDHVLNYMSLRLGILRIVSFTAHTITYGVYCMFALALVFYRLTIPQTKKSFIFKLIYILLWVNALCTLARSSILCLVLSQLLLLWFCGFQTFFKKMIKIAIPVLLAALILCLFSAKFRNMVQLAFYMVMALFQDEYVDYLVRANFGSNANAIGQRFDLYLWIWDAVKENLLFGMGRATAFQHYFTTAAGNRLLKESIEVEWLRTLFRYGIPSMIAQILFFLSLLYSSFKRRSEAAEWEGKISFSTVCFVLFLCYTMVQFAVMQNEDMFFFFFIMCLYLSYLMYDKYSYGGRRL